MYTKFNDNGDFIISPTINNAAVYARNAAFVNKGGYSLHFQEDGNLVMYTREMQAIWATGTIDSAGAYLVISYTGTFGVFSASGQAIWLVGQMNHPGSFLSIQVDGNLVLYNKQFVPLWASNTYNNCDT